MLVVALLGGVFWGHQFWPQTTRGLILREPEQHYDLIDTIIACEITPTSDFPELAGLKKELQTVQIKLQQ